MVSNISYTNNCLDIMMIWEIYYYKKKIEPYQFSCLFYMIYIGSKSSYPYQSFINK